MITGKIAENIPSVLLMKKSAIYAPTIPTRLFVPLKLFSGLKTLKRSENNLALPDHNANMIAGSEVKIWKRQ